MNALLDVYLEDASMEGFVFEIEVARRAFDHFDKVSNSRETCFIWMMTVISNLE